MANFLDSIAKLAQAIASNASRNLPAPPPSQGGGRDPFERLVPASSGGQRWTPPNTVTSDTFTRWTPPTEPSKPTDEENKQVGWFSEDYAGSEGAAQSRSLEDILEGWEQSRDPFGGPRLTEAVNPGYAERRAQREANLVPQLFDQPSTDFNELTTEQYNKLSERERAAVDYNTMLYQAVQKDLKNQSEYDSQISEDARGRYQAATSELFGNDRGSDQYAPETVALLKQLELNDPVADLDDFLNLRAVVTDEDLNLLKAQVGQRAELPLPMGGSVLSDTVNLARAGTANPNDPSRYDYVDDLASKAERLTETLARGNALLQNISSSAQSANVWRRDFDLQDDEDAEEPMLGFGTGETDDAFRQAYDVLSDRGRELAPGEAQRLLAESFPGENLDAFFRFADIRSQNSERYGQPMGETEGVRYRTPEEFRELLGLDR